MNYTIKVEGQEIAVPENIGENDELLTRALAPVYPGIANAQIKRILDKEDDQHTIVEVIKRAGTKGNSSPLSRLTACGGGMNPAIAFYMTHEALTLMGKSPDEIDEFQEQITAACEQGQMQGNMVGAALGRLQTASPIPDCLVPVGF